MPRQRLILPLIVVGHVIFAGTARAQSIARAVVAPVSLQTSVGSATGLQSRITLNLDGVPFSDALKAVAREASLKITITDPAVRTKKRVTLAARGMAAAAVLDSVLKGTAVRMTTLPRGQLLFDVAASRMAAIQGNISGRVVDGATKRPIAGAVVQVERTSRGTQTADDGSFRLGEIPAGTHTVVIRRLGYAKATRSVTVGDGATTQLDVVLDASVNSLEQVVVTGTVVQTELKAVPNAMTIVTAKQLEERGITRLDQLFRGDIPGVFAPTIGSGSPLDEVIMCSRVSISQ